MPIHHVRLPLFVASALLTAVWQDYARISSLGAVVSNAFVQSAILRSMKTQVALDNLHASVPPLLQLCAMAGDAICAHYRAPAAAEYQAKADESPLTRADLASHGILQAGLRDLDATIPVLSEESEPADIAQRRQWRRFWLVDPLDGTKEFLQRTGEFTINVALIDNHRPRLGMLYLPLQRRAYVGIPGVLAQAYTAGNNGRWHIEKLDTRRLQEDTPVQVLVSRRHRGERLQACLKWLRDNWGPVMRSNMGSALKFSEMSAGNGDFYPRFAPCCEWDTAAGHAVLEAAGGCVLGLDGQPLRYNCNASLYSPPFYAIAEPAHPLWQTLLRAQTSES